jgi:hypothetical protein
VSEVGDLANLQIAYADQGVVVLEVIQDAANEATLDGWPASDDYAVMRTSPSTQMQSDFGSAATFEGYPTFPLVDLQTMEVVNSDCWYASSWQACIDAAL